MGQVNLSPLKILIHISAFIPKEGSICQGITMNNTVLKDDTVMYYAIAVNGKVVSAKFSDRGAAEQARTSLPVEQQNIAEVVTVDSESRQLLLG